MKPAHRKKMIAPVLIIIGAVLSAIFSAVFTLSAEDVPWFVAAIAIAIPLGTAGFGIYVLIERIKEIQGGQEDDLSNY